VDQIEAFEAIAFARSLLDLTVSLAQGAQLMGMNAKATEACAGWYTYTSQHRSSMLVNCSKKIFD